jgi:hypothetical protein
MSDCLNSPRRIDQSGPPRKDDDEPDSKERRRRFLTIRADSFLRKSKIAREKVNDISASDMVSSMQFQKVGVDGMYQ